MSVKIMSAVWVVDLATTDKMVLLALADWSNDDGICWPSMNQLSVKTSLTDRAIRASVSRLKEAGHLTRQERPGKGVVYTVHPGTTFRPERDAPRNETTQTPEGRSANTSRTIITSEAIASSVERAKPRPSRRCPAAWSPSLEDMAVVDALGFSPGEIERELATLRDFEFRTAHADWSATFRNWMRREAKNRRPNNDRPSRPDLKLAAVSDNLARHFAGSEQAADLMASRRAY